MRSPRYTLRSGRRVLGTIRPTETRDVYRWSSNVTKDGGVTTTLDNAIRRVLVEAGVSPRTHEVELSDETGKSRTIHTMPSGPGRDASRRRRRSSRDVDTSFVKKHWTKTKGYYLLAGPYDPETGHLIQDTRRRIYAKTRSAETAEKFRRMGFRSLESAWRLYKKRLSDFDLY